MSLMKGRPQETTTVNEVAQQNEYAGMSDEEKRAAKTGALLVKTRRYLRFFCLGGFLIGTIVCSLAEGHGFIESAVLCALFFGFIYGGLYLLGMLPLIYISKFVLYLKDLLGGSKNTRL